MGAFMFIHADITNPEKFMKYARLAPALIEKHGGRYRSMRGEVEQLEGKPDNRKIVVSEWPSMDAAREFWNSAEYGELKKLRAGAAEIDVHLIEITGD
ncbi:MAG: DUF1330 domain-containing protein [Woeseiaceae bacterium]|nr:DUF1330 domain-containing protein [Woeseiaceae bacterium]